MQVSQWTTDTIVVSALLIIAAAALGYVIASVRQGRQLSQLAAQLEMAEQTRVQADIQQQNLHNQLKGAEARSQELRVEEGRLKAQLEASVDNVARLGVELQERKNSGLDLLARLEDANRQHHETGRRLEAAQADGRSLQAQLNELRERLAQGDSSNELMLKERDRLKDELAENKRQETRIKAEFDERAASHAREVASFEQQKASLTEQFKLLSNEILEAKAQALQENSKLSLNAVMTPFQQSIDTFKREVQEIHHRETTQQGELRKELETLKALNQQITTEAHELSTALRGQKKLQGNWGELVLENVLDRSGLELGKDYQREVSFTTEEGRQRPDAVVYLPQGKHLIIDAKVSLNAYTRYVNAEDETERLIALKEHVHAVGSRIKELADRDYYKLPGLNSPDMVFMFIPIESAFVEALKADENLFQQAIENNVLVATPTTLLTSLNIVRQLWRYEDQNKHTAALASKADAVFKKLNTFLGSFEKIKKGLEVASEAYVKAEGQLVSGKGNLVKQVGDFKNLAPAIKAELPAYFVEKAALEIDFIPAQPDIASLTEVPEAQDLLAENDPEIEYGNS